jgi:hypothetical protein
VLSFCAIRKEVSGTSIRVLIGRDTKRGEEAPRMGTDGGVHDGDHIAELGLEGRAEVGAALDGNGAAGVCEFGEGANVAAVFELDA